MEPSQLIDQQIADLPDWRGQLFGRLRALILAAEPALTEEWKWGTAVWASDGPVCAVAAFKDHLKVNFFKGALLSDSQELFNSGLDAKTSREIDLFEGTALAEPAFQGLIRTAAAYNKASRK
jgi:hypothetical protein